MYSFARLIGKTRLVFVVAVVLGGLLVGPGFAHLGEQSLALIDQPIGVAAGVDEVLITHPFCLDVRFFDGTFNNANWPFTVFTNGGTASATQQLTGGNPLAFFRIVNTTPNAAPNAFGQVFPVFRRLGATYNPQTQGAIASIDYAEDSILIDGSGDGLGAGPALVQNGKSYIGPEHVTPSFLWTHFTNTNLKASDFDRLLPVSQWSANAATITDPTQHPDFSANGVPIQFGFWRGNTTGLGGSGGSQIGGIDNWTVTIHNTREVLKFDIDSNRFKTFASLPKGPAQGLANCHEDYIAISPGLGGFLQNTVYVVQGAVGEVKGANVLKIPPTGGTFTQFAFLPGCAPSRNSVTFDRWDAFGFDMVVACSNGPIWRVDSNGAPTHIATVVATGPVEGIDQAPPAFRPFGTCMFVAAANDFTPIGSDDSPGTVFAVCPSGAVFTATHVAKWPRAEYVRFVPPIVTSCVTDGAFFQAIFPTSVFKFPQSAFSGLNGQALVASELNSGEEGGRGIGRLQSVTDQTGSRIVVAPQPFHGNTDPNDPLFAAHFEGAAFCGSIHLPPGAVKVNPDPLNPNDQGEYMVTIFSTNFLDVKRIDPTTVKSGPNGFEAPALRCELVIGGTALRCHFSTAAANFVKTDKFVPAHGVVVSGCTFDCKPGDQGFDGGG